MAILSIYLQRHNKSITHKSVASAVEDLETNNVEILTALASPSSQFVSKRNSAQTWVEMHEAFEVVS